MNRLSFLKKLGIGAVAVVVAPKILTEVKDKDVIVITDPKGVEAWKSITYKPKTISSHIAISGDSLNNFSPELIYTQAQLEADFRLSKYINDAIWLYYGY